MNTLLPLQCNKCQCSMNSFGPSLPNNHLARWRGRALQTRMEWYISGTGTLAGTSGPWRMKGVARERQSPVHRLNNLNNGNHPNRLSPMNTGVLHPDISNLVWNLDRSYLFVLVGYLFIPEWNWLTPDDQCPEAFIVNAGMVKAKVLAHESQVSSEPTPDMLQFSEERCLSLVGTICA